MLKKRLIPCLDIKEGRTVKGIKFENLRDVGDPVSLAKRYVTQGADELVFLDITATIENRKTLLQLVSQVAQEINIPFTVGGGISSLDQVEALLSAGADKISINSAAVSTPQLINDIAQEFGSQFVTVAIDTKSVNEIPLVHTHGGRQPTQQETTVWCSEVESRGAGEILLTSMDHDGTKTGFAIDITAQICNSINIPVIASGGAGSAQHFSDLFQQTNVSAGLAASIFHNNEISIPSLKSYLSKNKIAIRCK